MIALLFLGLAQAGTQAAEDAGRSVGDTVWVQRSIGTIRGAVVRPQPWVLGALGQQLGPAQVGLGTGGTLVRYALVFWYPGDHQLKMPGPVLVLPDGRSDTLSAAAVRIQINSVLPAAENPSTLAPSPASAPLPLQAHTLLPLVVLLAAVGVALGVAALLWRRRGRIPPRPSAVVPDPPANVLRQWAAAGEYRAALHEWGWVLACRLRASQDLNETAQLQRVLDEISFSSFSPHPPAQLAALCERAARLAGA